jgi:hypothetical protein
VPEPSQEPSPKGGHWLGRGLAVAGTIAAFAILLRNLNATDVFVEPATAKCPQRTLTLVPFVLGTLAALLALRYAIYGDSLGFRPRDPARRLPPTAADRARAVAWWSLLGLGLAGEAWVLYWNFTWAVLFETAAATGKGLLAIGGMAAAIAAIVGGLTFSGWRRQRASALELAAMPGSEREAVLRAIDDASSRGPWYVLHLQRPGTPPAPAGSRVGGDPFLAQGELWPAGPDGVPGRFLLQLTLSAPRLGAAWQDRLVTCFDADWQLVVRSHAPGAPGDAAENGRAKRLPERPLRPLRIPYRASAEDDEQDPPYFPSELLARIPGLRAQLERFSRRPAELLPRILEASPGPGLDTSDVVLEGGDPELIQGPHEATCPDCGASMRFLFQFGDPTGQYAFGDGGVAYVYGCDAHPERCLGFVDCS